MAKLRSHKLLLCVGILSILAMAPTAAATDDTEETGPCAEVDEERDTEGECCIPNLMVGEDGEEKCAEVPSDMAVASAVTLIGSFVFMISLQFAMNHPDQDMQEHAYIVISSTVSIFSAVLLFQSIDGLIEDLIIEPLGGSYFFQLLVDGIHMLLWYALTQLVIAKVSGALMPEETRERLLAGLVMTAHVEAGSFEIPVLDTSALSRGMRVFVENDTTTVTAVAAGVITTRSPARCDYEEGTPVEIKFKEDIELNCQCYGMVLAHLTGFASINFWTTIQEINPFNQSPLLALMPLPMSLIGQLILQRITDRQRESYAAGDDKKDWFEDKWDEQCEEAEDDIMGLSLSVIIVNACRFSLNRRYGHGCLPNHEQKEEGEACEFERSLPEALWLLVYGVIFAVALFITKLIVGKCCPEEEEQEEEEGKKEGITDEERADKLQTGSAASAMCPMPSLLNKEGVEEENEKPLLPNKEEGEEEEEKEKPLMDQIKERVTEVLIVTLSMSFSWCIFHGSRQVLQVMNPGFLGKEENSGTLALALSLIVTYMAFILMRILDLIADLPDEYTPKSVDDAIRQVMTAMSIFIGFAWEQTFDESVDNIAERMRVYGPHSPAFAKLIVGAGCVGVVFIAWKWYILPFVVKQGWKFTYVYSKQDLLSASRALAADDEDHVPIHNALESHMSSPEKAYKSLAANEVEAIQNEVKMSREKNSVLELDLQKERKQREDLQVAGQNQVRTLEAEKAEVEEMAADLEIELQEERLRQADAEGERKKQLDMLDEENAKVQKAVSILEVELQKERKRHESAEIYKEKKLKTLREENEALKVELQRGRKQHGDAEMDKQKEINMLREANKALEVELQKERKRPEDAENEEEELKMVREEHQKVQEFASDLQLEFESLRKRHEDAEADKQKELKMLREEHEKVQKLASDLKLEFEKFRKAVGYQEVEEVEI